jgi:hypothetical protein
VEQIEARSLLSGGITGSSAMALVARQSINRTLALNGTFQGKFQEIVSIPDVGSTFDATGSGHLHRIGLTSVSATIQTTGFIRQGHASGSLKLLGAHGTITLELTGPDQGGFAGLPDSFRYSIASGTGKYQHAHGQGTASLVTDPTGPQQNLNTREFGSFKLVLTSTRGVATM